MLRQPAGGIPVPQGMNQPMFSNLNTPHLISQQQQLQPGQQPQGPANPMAMLSNPSNPTQSMGLLGAGGQPNGAMTNPNYSLQLQAAQRKVQMTQPGMNQGLPMSAQPNLNGVGPNVQFGNPLLQRVGPQNPRMNAVGAHGMNMSGVPPNMGGVPGYSGMVRRPMPHQQTQITGAQAGMPNDMSMLRSGLQNAAQFPGIPRSASSQAHHMQNMQSPSSFPPSMQSMQQPFPNAPMQQPQQQHHPQPPQMANSPHPPHNAHPTQIPAGFAAQQQLMPQSMQNRMTPDQNMLLGLQQNAQMTPNLQHAGPRMAPNGGPSFQFSTSAHPNQMGDVSPAVHNGIPALPGTMRTPAQTLKDLQGNNDGSFGMAPPPQQGPPRPPSQQRPHPGFQMHPSHQQAVGAHSSPRQMGQQLQAQRPQSQPQVQHQQQGSSPGQAAGGGGGLTRTPRLSQQQIATHNAGGPSQPRIPTGPPQQLAPPMVKPPTPSITGAGASVGAGHPSMPSAPRPPQMVQTPVVAPAVPPVPPAAAAQPPSGPAGPPAGTALITPQEAPAQLAQPPPVSVQLYQQAAIANQKIGAMPISQASALLAITKFSAFLALQTPEKMHLKFWERNLLEYFANEAMLKITLWKDNRRDEAKPFEIGTSIIPRFFLVTAQSGVKAISIHFEGLRERAISPYRCVIESTQAVWTFKYTNGYVVTLRGPLTAYVTAIQNTQRDNPKEPDPWVRRIEHLYFDALFHDKYIDVQEIRGSRRMLDSPYIAPEHLTDGERERDEDRRDEDLRMAIDSASMPAEPVNAFGIPQATMRCLELAESVAQMGDLIQFASEHRLGPRDSLAHFAERLRKEKAQTAPAGAVTSLNGNMGSGPAPGATSDELGSALPGINGATPAGSSSSLYPNSPASTSTQPQQPAPPQNMPVTGTPKQSNAFPPGQATQVSTPGPVSASTPAAAATPTAATSTPAMSHSTLKRKATTQGPDPSLPPPGAAADQQPPGPKRPARKRGRTGGG